MQRYLEGGLVERPPLPPKHTHTADAVFTAAELRKIMYQDVVCLVKCWS